MIAHWKMKNTDNPIEILGISAFRVLGGGGRVLGVICVVSFKKRLARKLCRIILLYFGLITFRFHFRKTRKPFIVMDFEPSGHDHGPQNLLYLTLDRPNYSKEFENKSPIMF